MVERGVSGKKQLVCSHLVQFCVRRNEKSSCGVFSSKQAKSIHQRLCHYCPDECKRCQKEQGLNSFPLLRSSVSESSWVGGFKVSVCLFSFGGFESVAILKEFGVWN